jgi:hypothetical protein
MVRKCSRRGSEGRPLLEIQGNHVPGLLDLHKPTVLLGQHACGLEVNAVGQRAAR